MACLGDETIVAMLEGVLADDVAHTARVHLGSCDACRRLVADAVEATVPASASAIARRSQIGPGSVLAGRYVVDRMLGEGGMGRVFAARQLGLDRAVAIKVLLPELARDPQALARFHREARLVASLIGQHVVRVFDLGALDTGEPFLVMELLDGEDLGTRADRGPIPLDQALAWTLAACDALAEAHALGVVHRDIKPSNLFVTRQGRLVVLDFGLAKLADGSVSMTGAGALLGSPRYMPPEQVSGARDVDTRADIWALGATLYHLATGRPPFPETTIDGVLTSILSGRTPPLDGLPPHVAVAIHRALQSDRAQRFASIADFAAALRGTAPTVARYELVELIGEGSHGAVYRARQRGGREVAIKLLRASGDRERFAREADIVARLEHPNTVRMLESGHAGDGTPYMVFELVRGRTLAADIARGPLAPARVHRIAAQVLKALMEAHALGVVHRDVTPANILLVDHAGEPDHVKLFDFGVATVDTAPNLTSTGQVVGTPRYMAPEQVTGAHVDGRTDLYALGLVMCEALTGQPVVSGPSAMAVCVQQASSEPVAIPPVVLASPLGAVIARATAKAPAARFVSAQDMLAALEHPAAIAVSRASSAPTLAIVVGLAIAAGIATTLLAWKPWVTPAQPEPSTAVAAPKPAPPPAPPPQPAMATGAGPLGNIDEDRLHTRLDKLGWHVAEVTREQFPGCAHTRLRCERGKLEDQTYAFADVYLFTCDSAGAASDAANLQRRGGKGWWIVSDGNLVLLVGAGTGVGSEEKMSKQLYDQLVVP